MKLRLCILGKPGSGKGTVSEILAKRFKNLNHFNVGGILRKLASEDKHIEKIHKEGGLVDSNRVLGIFDTALSKDSFILDGSPRKGNEAEYVLNHQLWLDDPGYLIVLDISDDKAKERLLARGRKDDKENILDTRFKCFEEETKKSIEIFQNKNKLIRVDADRDVESIVEEIVNRVYHDITN